MDGSGARNSKCCKLICSEPFRLFFPAGVIVSVLGVSLWPLFYGGVISFGPHVPHARLMIEGFLGAFVFGFMGTAFPRMIETPSLGRRELACLFGLYVLAAGMHLSGRVTWGDGFFLAALLFFLARMGGRLIFQRLDLPPPGFVLAGMGLLGAVAGIAVPLAAQVVTVPLFLLRFASLLLNEGFILFPVLGVGAFFFPKLLGLMSRDKCPDSKVPTQAWRSRAAVAGICGLVMWGSFALEAGDWIREGRLLRAFVVAAYFLKAAPVFRKAAMRGTLGFSMRVGVVMIFAGLLATAFYPQFQKGFDHLLFISGFGLLALSVASRVILGHAERLDLAEGRSRPMQWIVWIVLLAAATRASADPLPHIAVSHHIYGAILWAAAVAVWGFWLFPKLKER